MAGALLDLERVGAGKGFPGDAGRTEIVERDVLRSRGVLVQVGAGDAGTSQVVAQGGREVFERREAVAGVLVRVIVLHNQAFPVHFIVQMMDQGKQRAVDRNPTSHPGLRRLDQSGLEIQCAVNADVLLLEVHIVPTEHREFPRTRVQIDRQGVEASPARADVTVAGTEKQRRFGREQPLLGFHDARIRAAHSHRRIVVANAQDGRLRLARITEQLGYETPNFLGRTPREHSVEHLAIERLDHLA